MKKTSDDNQWKDDFPDGEDEELVKRQMWAYIENATLLNTEKKVGKKNRSVKLTLYSAVASLILLAGILLVFQMNRFARTTTINNMNELQVRQVEIGELKFILQPKSECTIRRTLIDGAISLKFCGAVSVQNSATSAQEINVASGLFSCTIVVKDKVNLHKGQIYLAMTDQKYSMISATTDEIIDGLPRSFSSRLEKRFNL